jgi:hypothetical protein
MAKSFGWLPEQVDSLEAVLVQDLLTIDEKVIKKQSEMK